MNRSARFNPLLLVCSASWDGIPLAATRRLLALRPGRWVPFAALLIAAACSSDDRPVAPRTGPEFAISDAVHEGGTPGFFFLPPMVAQPAFSGTFNADITTLNPQIAICDVTNGPDSNCGGSGGTAAVIVFTTTSTPPITVDLTTPQYQVNWNTQGAGFTTGHTYRLHVTATTACGARRELGFADVLLTTTSGQVKQLATGDIIVLQDGRTLPIHVRIETGATGDCPPLPTILLPNPLKIAVGLTGQLTATLSPTPAAAGTVSVSSADLAVATVPASVAFAIGQSSVPVTVTAVAAGSTQITVSLNGGRVSCTVQVFTDPCISDRHEWSIATNNAPAAAPVVSATTTYVAQGTRLYAVDNVAGTIRWIWDSPMGGTLSAPAVVTISGRETLFQAVSDGFLHKIDAETGVTEGSLDTRRRGSLGTLVCDADGLSSPTVQRYEASSSAFRAALDAAGRTGDNLVVVATVDRCGDMTHNRVLGIYASDLAWKWIFNASGDFKVATIYSACALSYHDDRLFCGTDLPGGFSSQESLFALESISGQFMWGGNAGAILTHVALAGSRVYVANQAGSLMAYDPAGDGLGNAVPLWTNALSVGSVGITRDLAVATTTSTFFFVVDNGGTLHMAVDQGSSGALVWDRIAESGANFMTRPVVAPGLGKVYVGRDDGTVQQIEWSGGVLQGVVDVGPPGVAVFDPTFDGTGGVLRLVVAATGRAARLILPFCERAPV